MNRSGPQNSQFAKYQPLHLSPMMEYHATRPRANGEMDHVSLSPGFHYPNRTDLQAQHWAGSSGVNSPYPLADYRSSQYQSSLSSQLSEGPTANPAYVGTEAPFRAIDHDPYYSPWPLTNIAHGATVTVESANPQAIAHQTFLHPMVWTGAGANAKGITHTVNQFQPGNQTSPLLGMSLRSGDASQQVGSPRQDHWSFRTLGSSNIPYDSMFPLRQEMYPEVRRRGPRQATDEPSSAMASNSAPVRRPSLKGAASASSSHLGAPTFGKSRMLHPSSAARNTNHSAKHESASNYRVSRRTLSDPGVHTTRKKRTLSAEGKRHANAVRRVLGGACGVCKNKKIKVCVLSQL